MRVLRTDARGLCAAGGQNKPSSVAVGIFDGVHLGHAELLRRCVALARAGGRRAVALTFAPHPAQVLRPEVAPPAIEPLAARLEHFAAVGLDLAVVLQFDAELAAWGAESFVDDLLADALNARDVVVGYDFAFGKGQAGSASVLRAMGQRGAGVARVAFALHQLEAVRVGDAVASSTEVRGRVAAGNVAGARALLGRPYVLYGEVERGLQRGRTLGFPTANLRAHSALVPGSGIYAAWAHGRFGRAPAAVSVGVNPTFTPLSAPVVEAHLIDYAGPSLYGAPLRLHFVARLRGEKKFANVADLVAQMQRDCTEVRRRLAVDAAPLSH